MTWPDNDCGISFYVKAEQLSAIADSLPQIRAVLQRVYVHELKNFANGSFRLGDPQPSPTIIFYRAGLS